jgi:hypothetical protein
MIVDLVRTTTADGVRLDGTLVPAEKRDPVCAVDALLLWHGTGANFYASSLLEALAQHFAAAGIAVLLANTRGRDILYVSAVNGQACRLGAACERVDDCRHDLAAWFTWLQGRGFERIGLIGHSLGAIKGVYALAQPQAPAIAWLCAISPARLSHEYFLKSPKADEFRRTLERAQRCVAEGAPETLLEVEFPIPYVVTAAGYLDKYGPGERFNVLTHLRRLPCPTLFTFGSAELQTHVAFRGLDEAITTAAHDSETGNSAIQVATIAGADHVYSGCRSELIARIDNWLRTLSPGETY